MIHYKISSILVYLKIYFQSFYLCVLRWFHTNMTQIFILKIWISFVSALKQIFTNAACFNLIRKKACANMKLARLWCRNRSHSETNNNQRNKSIRINIDGIGRRMKIFASHQEACSAFWSAERFGAKIRKIKLLKFKEGIESDFCNVLLYFMQ